MRHRRLTPVSPIAEPAAELCAFDELEWVSPGDQGWGPAFCRWIEARRSWISKHGAEGLGGWLTVLRAEHQTRNSMYAQEEPR
jgi:hypothetical protein